ncbi:Frataxin [Phlebopus sp. FC_14]|nr:Frataxin [Phlebopus sp. FC_14]
MVVCRRALSTPAPHINHSDLPMERYHALSDATMTTMLERLEDLLDEIANNTLEVDYHSGVLTLNLASHGTYVINKQPPNKQIWLSSPISGPKRYDYVPATDNWRYSRDGQGLDELMERELGSILGREVKLGLERVSEMVE